MPTENQTTQPARSLTTGHHLDAMTWTDFVQRRHHDCVGEGVHDHCTSATLFTVQTKRIDYGELRVYVESQYYA